MSSETLLELVEEIANIKSEKPWTKIPIPINKLSGEDLIFILKLLGIVSEIAQSEKILSKDREELSHPKTPSV